ncbi:MAG: Ribose import ATP-binding protein RbsA [Alphaproteobacteria bacterium MarineAlpha5_Bin9]|nr:MAG: Ribose import ATP-binding protein RbsA [Alphaproteobacteria bacterium MarineAlpha5_Bin9]|tara:strand:- start:462 stop:1982 length:1521 start_codon:yes stop_codon:yes gene_type:complete
MLNNKYNNHFVEFKNITKKFPRVIANNNISFNIKKGSVHALLGENGAGKSTLVKVLYGLLSADIGYINFNNEVLKINSPSQARKKGIGMVFQHFSLFESLTVRDNLILGIDDQISYSNLQNKLQDISSKYNLPLDLDAPITSLSAGEKQRVEIVRILLQDPQLLIMDEPTSVLTPKEVENLFLTLNYLVKEGRTILYITHKLEEVIKICNDVTIMRNGKVIDSCTTKDQTAKSLATKMLGQKLEDLKTDYSHIKNIENFIVNNISCSFNDPFLTDLKNISFQVREGEIYGIAGVAGNGQSELMDILTGENTLIDEGEIIFNKKNIKLFNPQQRRNLSIAFVPENRLGHSAVPELSLTENILLSQFPNNQFSINGILNEKAIDKYANKVIKNFNVVTPGSDALASSLSGGNLQKFVIGREISSIPKLLIISHPTWGIDAGAEHSIREALIKLSKNGTSIIVISQDLDELIEITHRISVIFEGKLSEPLQTDKVDISRLGLLMGGKND